MARKSIRIGMMLRALRNDSRTTKKVTNNYNELSFYWGAAAAAQELARQGFITEEQGKIISRNIVREMQR